MTVDVRFLDKLRRDEYIPLLSRIRTRWTTVAANRSWGYLGDLGAMQTILSSYSGQHEYDPYGSDAQNALKFLTEVANMERA